MSSIGQHRPWVFVSVWHITHHVSRTRTETRIRRVRVAQVILANHLGFGSMSDDEFFGDELDSAFLDEVAAIEAAASVQVNPQQERSIRPSKRQRTPPSVIELSDSDAFDSFALDDEALKQIDQICAEQLDSRRSHPVAGPSRVVPARPSTKGSIQTTLFGDIVQPGSKKSFQRSHSKTSPKEEKRTKKWDHTMFAKTGWKSSKASGKGKGSFDAEQEGDLEEEVEFEQFPAPSAVIESVIAIFYIWSTANASSVR